MYEELVCQQMVLLICLQQDVTKMNLQARINYQDSLKTLLSKLCAGFAVGSYQSHTLLPVGYEDCNLAMVTSKGKYFVKIFNKSRSQSECKRYIDVILHVLRLGVAHPKLYESSQGYLYESRFGEAIDRACVMEYIDGKMLYEMQRVPTVPEIRFILKQVALIHAVPFKPPFIYDNWAIPSFLEQYEIKKIHLNKEDKNVIDPLTAIFKKLSLKNLPHSFIHGDLTSINVMRANNGKLFLLDFAVANYYPRIIELAVLLSDLFFDYRNQKNLLSAMGFVVSEYQKYNTLTPEEIKILPALLRIGFAMFVICASYEKAQGNMSDVNEHFLTVGRGGLRITADI